MFELYVHYTDISWDATMAGRGILSPTGSVGDLNSIAWFVFTQNWKTSCINLRNRVLLGWYDHFSISINSGVAKHFQPSQYLIKRMVTGKTWNVINIPIIPNVWAVQYSTRDVTALPTSSGTALQYIIHGAHGVCALESSSYKNDNA